MCYSFAMNSKRDWLEIKQLRAKLGYTQLQLALALGVSPGTVHRWESDKCNPSPLAMIRLSYLKLESSHKG